MIIRTSPAAITLASFLLLTGLASVAHADPPANSLAKDAGLHFQRGVALFNEADYRAALVEFRRAYDIAPKTAVLYNIGQTYYQLQNYAAALIMLQRYVTESPASAPHASEVQQTIDILRTRVGSLAITTNVPGCEISVDDELVGKTPLTEPVLVSIGRRKVVVTHDGRSDEVRQVDVAAGDTVTLSIVLADPNGRVSAPVPTAAPERGADWVTRGWIATGVLGAGWITTGILAYTASRDLQAARRKFPASASDLNSAATRVTRFSVAADVLGIATAITGGITLKLTLSQTRTHEAHIALAPNGIQFAGSFQ
jgi:tetratricopeptide (TPR) repeat protein